MDVNESSTSNGGEEAKITVKEEPKEETEVLNTEPESPVGEGKISYEDVLAFLRKKGLSGTEALLQKESGSIPDDKGTHTPDNTGSTQSAATGSAQISNISKEEASGAEVSNVLSSYKSEGDPNIYSEAYKDLQRFVESSLDLYRHELALILVSFH